MDPPSVTSTAKAPSTTAIKSPQTVVTTQSQKMPTQTTPKSTVGTTTSTSQVKPLLKPTLTTSTTVGATSTTTAKVPQATSTTQQSKPTTVQSTGLKQNKIRQPSPKKGTGTTQNQDNQTSQAQHLVAVDDAKKIEDQKLSKEMNEAKKKARNLAIQKSQLERDLELQKLKIQSQERKGKWLKYAAIIMMILVVIHGMFIQVKLPNQKECECPKPDLKPCPPKPVDVIIDVTGDDVIIIDVDVDKHEDKDKDIADIVIDKKDDIEIHNYFFQYDSKKVENNLLLVLHSIKKHLSREAEDTHAFNSLLRLDGQVQYYDQISKENLYREAFAQLIYLNQQQKERTNYKNQNLDYTIKLPCYFDSNRVSYQHRFGRDCLFKEHIIKAGDRQNVEYFTELMLKQDQYTKNFYTQQDYSKDNLLLSFLKQSRDLYQEDHRIYYAFDQLNKALFTEKELTIIDNYKY